MLESRTISVTINRNWKEIYEAFWRPEDFQKWASGLSKSSLTKDGDAWHGYYGRCDWYFMHFLRRALPACTSADP